MKSIISSAIAAFVVVGFATVAIGGDHKPAFKKEDYIGLRAELRQADAVLRLTVSEITSMKDSPEVKITGTVISSLKGDLAKPGDTLSLSVDAEEHRRRFGDHWHAGFFMGYVPSKGDKGAFLVMKSGGRLEVVSIISGPRGPDDFLRRYLEIAEARAEQASVQLAKLIFREAFEPGYGDEGRLAVLFIDWKMFYPYLPQHSEAFTELVNRYYPRVLEIDEHVGIRLEYMVWLATFVPESQRREVVKLLLGLYERVDKKVRETRKNPPKSVPGAELTWEQAVAGYFLGLWARLPYWIEIVMNPIIADRLGPNFNPGERTRKEPKEILKDAEEFVKK